EKNSTWYYFPTCRTKRFSCFIGLPALFLLVASPARAAIAFVQQGQNSNTVSPLTVTLPSGVGAGNTLIAVINSDSGISSMSSIVGGGVTWVLYASTTSTANGKNRLTYLYYGLNSSGTSGATTSTCTF